MHLNWHGPLNLQAASYSPVDDPKVDCKGMQFCFGRKINHFTCPDNERQTERERERKLFGVLDELRRTLHWCNIAARSSESWTGMVVRRKVPEPLGSCHFQDSASSKRS